MTCNNCARHVTEAIQGVTGVERAAVSLEANLATVRWKAGAAQGVDAVMEAVKAAGYGAKLDASQSTRVGSTRGWSPLAGWKFNVVVGSICTVPLMIGEWIFQLGMEPWYRWLSFALALVVQVGCGAKFFRGAWNQLKAGSSNMDTLVSLGSVTAFGYSTWALLASQPGHLYFMEAAAIITLVSTGHWMEARMSTRAAGALRALLNLAPPLARRLYRDGSESEVPVAELQVDHQVVLKPGDRVPTDGEVLEGESAVDESMLTGESAPLDKSAKARLFAGTSNLNGRLVMRVTATGEATALAHIIAAVQRAQSSRANIQRLGDRVSNVFVPIVVAVALAAGLWWGLAPERAKAVHDWLAQFLWAAHPPAGALAAAFIIAAGVLIVACPCAMGLATPAAIMAGTNAAARRGILIRDGVALEKAGRVTAVVFDKTGTLTQGKPEVVKFEVVAGRAPSVDEAKNLAVALASHSNHPLSQSVARLGSTPGAVSTHFTIRDWQEVRGAGVMGTSLVAENPAAVVRLGSSRWLHECGVDVTAAGSFEAEWSAQGATILGLAAEQSLVAVVAVKDTLKPGARAVVEQLLRGGHGVYLVTGDNKLTAAAIAQQAGIPAENVFSEVRPEQKAELVKRLQGRGQRVAFVGDGINDAPALEQADLGIAVSRASDIAREAADIILLNSEIEAVPESLGLAQATLRTIKQNLFWAFFYNAVGVPLAALGFMSPVLCALAMGFSDVIVIGNALRLRRWK